MCGAVSQILRYHIIPSQYRKHFPVEYKAHMSCDVVLLCVACHQVAHQRLTKLKKQIASEFEVPLSPRKRQATKEMEILHNAKKAASALNKAANAMPLERVRVLKQQILLVEPFINNEEFQPFSDNPSSVYSTSEAEAGF